MSSPDETSALPLFVLHEHSGAVLSCSFYPSDKYDREQSSWFLSGDVNGEVMLWKLTTRRPVLSFSALSEARRQLAENARRDDEDAGGATSADARIASLGPHSQSVLSVGFIPATVSASAPSEAAAGGASTTVPTDQTSFQEPQPQQRQSVEGQSIIALNAVAVATADSGNAKRNADPPRQRFRLTRRAPPSLPLKAAAFSTDTASCESSASPQDPQSLSPICFYTHCRDQRVYIWRFCRTKILSRDAATQPLRLMAVLTAPQHGFCPVESVSVFNRTYLTVPHDTHGELTVWQLEWQPVQRHETRQKERAVLLNKEVDIKDASSGVVSDAINDESVEARDDDVSSGSEKVDTTGMNPMDALIARAAAEERQQAKKRLGNCAPDDTDGEGRLLGASASAPSNPAGAGVVSGTERASFLCFVAPCATTSASGFSIRRLCSFSACPHFKGGTIMGLTMCSDAQHVAVAFESGHVVLARFRVPHAEVTKRKDSGKLRVQHPSLYVPQVRCALRVFAESALVCWWSGSRVVACSAEGGIHCYEVAPCAQDKSALSSRPFALQLQLLWSTTLRKGIGSVAIQANLIVVACWDSTLRLYDARDGRLVSILTYQKESINGVQMAPAVIARTAAFGFDARQPRCYAPHEGIGASPSSPPPSPRQRTITAAGKAESHEIDRVYEERKETQETLVYLFASASKDGSIALWRLDMGMIAQRLSAKATTV